MKLANGVWIWATLAMLGYAHSLPADDWPQWRYDSYRSAESPETLPSDLHLEWSRQFAPRVQTWDDPLNNDLMTFDRIFEPIVLGDQLFIGFNDCDKLLALDTETGDEVWTFFTDGPVRLPPAAWKGKVYFTSDDGYLYCVSAKEGKLIWKFRGGPSERKVLGNGRVISAWPARGGPVIQDGQVYFAASIWPFMGTYIYALDAETGRVIWVNDGTGAQYIKQPHSAPSFAGVAPQGALVATKEYLLVPGGRSVPAAFERKTGKFVHFQLEDSGKGNGGSFVVANDSDFFVHTRQRGTRIYDLKVGKKGTFTINEPVVSTNRFYSAQANSSLKTALLDAWNKRNDAALSEFEAWKDINRAEEEGNKDAFKNATNAYASAQRKIGRAEKELAAAQKKLGTNWDGAVLQAVGMDKNIRWEIPAEGPGEMIKAGRRLYMAGTNALYAYDLPPDKSKARLLWSNYVDGRVLRLLAANGKLFAVTLDGRILCFGKGHPEFVASGSLSSSGGGEGGSGEVKQNGHPSGPSVSGAGYALWFGVDDGQLLGAFLRESQLHIVAVDPDPAKINALRLTFAAAGTYGHRIVLHVGDPIRFKAPPYIANLVVVGESLATHLSEPRVLQAAYESVRPYGGRLWIQADKARSEALVNEIAAANLPQAKIYVEAGGVAIIREGALAGSADWTHQYGNVANTVKSDDRRVKLPLGLLWFGGNTHNDVLPRHGHGPSEQVIDGRLFIEGMDCLSARDVYTGRVLWKREFAELGNFGIYFDESYTNVPLSTVYGQKHIPGANARGANFVATSEAIYLLATNKCLVLDPATGKLLRKIEASFGSPSEATRWAYIGVCEDVLLAGIDFANYTRQFALWPTNNPSASNRPPTAVDLSASRALVGFDRHTGEVLWRQEAHHSFVHNAIVAGNGRVFCIDRLPNSARDKLKRRGRPAPKDFRLAAYNLHNGHLLWETTNNVIGTWLSYSGQHDVLLQAGASATDRLKDEAEQGMIAYNGKTGAILWSNLAVKYTGPCILHDDVILTTPTSYKTNAGAFGLLDGLPRGLRNPLTGQLEPLRIYRTYGCNYPVACENLLTFRSGAAGFFDLLNYSGSGNFGGFKSGCSPNLIAANGVLNAPDYTRTCTCPYQNQTSLAFVHWPGDELEYWTHNQFGVDTKEGIRIRRVGINFGAPGDRLERTGTLWLEHPSVGGSSPNLLVTVKGSKTNFFCRSSIAFGGEGPAWVMASGVTGIERVIIAPETRKKLPPPPAPKKKTGDDIEDKDEAEPEKNGNSQTNGVSSTASSTASITKTNPLPVELTNALTKAASTNKVEPPFVSTLTAAPYTVRLYFAEPEDLAPGLRVFDVELQGRLVLPAFDVVKAAGGVRRGIIKEFHGVTVEHDLTIKFTRAKGQTNGPLLNGVEMILEESAN